MSTTNSVKILRICKYSQRKQRWMHTTNGRSKLQKLDAEKYTYDEGDAESSGVSDPPTPTTPTLEPRSGSTSFDLPSFLQVITWNIDFMTPNASARVHAAIDHLQRDVLGCSDGQRPKPCAILLQEITPISLKTILEHTWIRSHFLLAPVKSSIWPTAAYSAWGSQVYGNATLVSRDVPVLSASILDFGTTQSFMGRHALFVDLCLAAPRERAGKGSKSTRSSSTSRSPDRGVTLRVANVHLESLPMGVSMRPLQLNATAELLREEGIHAGIVCGDMNAIQAEDVDIPEGAGLVDAWTGSNTDVEGYTWGYQPTCQFNPGRLDKILYTSIQHCEVEEPQRIGVDLKTKDGQWVSDHYGLMSTLRIVA